mmetsp:Transcript_1236/g.3323  ORF Transcript_1236/g.3323 Transcript_1236/m.3323 type:complete len:122 (-) Transcript_1236:989-1354(-)
MHSCTKACNAAGCCILSASLLWLAKYTCMSTERCCVRAHAAAVFFRKHTQAMAQQLHLHGWVMNTPQGSVVGEMQGDSVQVEEMKHWLSKVGSPKSSIERAVFTEERPIEACTFQDFEVRR